MRISWVSCSVRSDSWEKQHMVKRPCKMIARRGCEDDEKLLQMAFTASLSSMARLSSDWGVR